MLFHEILLGILIEYHFWNAIGFSLEHKPVYQVTIVTVSTDAIVVIEVTSVHICFLLCQQLHLLREPEVI